MSEQTCKAMRGKFQVFTSKGGRSKTASDAARKTDIQVPTPAAEAPAAGASQLPAVVTSAAAGSVAIPSSVARVKAASRQWQGREAASWGDAGRVGEGSALSSVVLRSSHPDTGLRAALCCPEGLLPRDNLP